MGEDQQEVVKGPGDTPFEKYEEVVFRNENDNWYRTGTIEEKCDELTKCKIKTSCTAHVYDGVDVKDVRRKRTAQVLEQAYEAIENLPEGDQVRKVLVNMDIGFMKDLNCIFTRGTFPVKGLYYDQGKNHEDCKKISDEGKTCKVDVGFRFTTLMAITTMDRQRANQIIN